MAQRLLRQIHLVLATEGSSDGAGRQPGHPAANSRHASSSAQGFLLGFLNDNLERHFQAWYHDQLLHRVDAYALVACLITHLLAFLPQTQKFSHVGMITSVISFAFGVGYLWAFTRSQASWKLYRRHLLIFRRLILLLLLQHVFAKIDAPPPVGWGGLFLRLVLTSGAFRIMIKLLVYTDLFVWSIPFGLLSLYSVAKPAAASLCGATTGILTRSDFAQIAVPQLNRHIAAAIALLPGTMNVPRAEWEQQCTQVVQVSQVLIGLVFPLAAVYWTEAYYRHRFLKSVRGVRLNQERPLLLALSDLVEFGLMIIFVTAIGLVTTGLSVAYV